MNHAGGMATGARGCALRSLPVGAAPCPAKWVQFPRVPMAHKIFNVFLLRYRRREIAMFDDTALQNREPHFDLIHPRCVNGRVHKPKPATVATIELRPACGGPVIMNIQIVPNHDHFFAAMLPR